MISKHEGRTLKLNSNWRTGGVALLLGFLCWFIFIISSPPRIPGGDLICFVDPGINMANGEGLVERLSPANHSLQPKFYANYPPLYPFIYGLYVSIVGHSAKTNEMFSFCLSAMATILFWFFIIPRNSRANHRLLLFGSILLTIALLPVGPFWIGLERPDSMGFIIMLLSLFCLRFGTETKFVFLAGLVAGINSLISPFAFVMNGMILVWILLVGDQFAALSDKFSRRRMLKQLIVLGGGIGIPLFLLFLIQWLNDPGAISRFANNASGKSSNGGAGLGYFLNLLKGNYQSYFSAFSRYNSINFKWRLAHLVFITILSLVILLRKFRRQLLMRAVLQFLAILSLAGFPLLIFPYQPFYMSMAAGMIPVLFVACASNEETSLHWMIVSSLAFLALIAVPYTLREFVIAYRTQDSYTRMAQFVNELRPMEGQPSLVVATSGNAYFFFKQRGFVVVDVAAVTANPNQFPGIDVFALGYNGEKIQISQRFPQWWDAGSVEPVYLPNFKSKTELFGFPIYNRIASWESCVYRLKK